MTEIFCVDQTTLFFVDLDINISLEENQDLYNALNKQRPFSPNISLRIFSICAPPTQYVMRPQLQITCHYIVNHYVKIWHVRRGGGGMNMRPLSWGHKRKRYQLASFHYAKLGTTLEKLKSAHN